MYIFTTMHKELLLGWTYKHHHLASKSQCI